MLIIPDLLGPKGVYVSETESSKEEEEDQDQDEEKEDKSLRGSIDQDKSK